MEFPADTKWVESFPSRFWRARAKEAAASIVVAVVAAYWGGWVLYSVLALLSVFWVATLLLYQPESVMRSAASSKVEISEEGMRQSSLGIRGSKAIEMFSPWSSIELKGVKRENGEVQEIAVVDSSLPKGVRNIRLEGYKNMSGLLKEIESRTAANQNA